MFFCEFNGIPVLSAGVTIPSFGVWTADISLDREISIPTTGTLIIGDVTMIGTIEPEFSSTYCSKSILHLTGGKNAWGNILAKKAYHNDAGVKTKSIVMDLARETGETMGRVELSTVLGVDFVRRLGPASRTMELACKDTPWYVDYSGITHVEQRNTRETSVKYDVVSYDPMFKLATVATDTPSGIVIGSILRDKHLRLPLEVRQIELSVKKNKLRMACWGREL